MEVWPIRTGIPLAALYDSPFPKVLKERSLSLSATSIDEYAITVSASLMVRGFSSMLNTANKLFYKSLCLFLTLVTIHYRLVQ